MGSGPIFPGSGPGLIGRDLAKKVVENAIQAASDAFGAAQKVVNDSAKDPRLAVEGAARVAGSHLQAPGIAIGFLGAVLSYLAEGGAVILDTITKSKLEGQTGIHDLIVAALGDVLQLDITSEDVPVGKGAAGQRAVNNALGSKFLEQVKGMFGAGEAVTGDTAEKAAASFLGFGMQFSASVGFLGLLGELFSFGHIKEVAEIGEMLEKSLGLGRLTRRVMAPYIRNLIAQPLDRKMRAQYRQDLLGAAELVKGMLSGRIPVDQARGFIAQHGLSDQFIDELAEQHKPRLHPEETELLVALGKAPTDSAANSIYADGTPKDVIDARLAVLTWKRLNHLRTAILNEVFSQVQHGGADSTLMDSALSDLGIPDDEAALWRKRVTYLQTGPRRRLNIGEMLFLFEQSQVTLDQVQQWAASQGYSQEDQLNLQLYFELKATAAHRTASGNPAAAAQHVHDEHVAYVTDLYESILGRKPDASGLAGWVALLDNRQRTKADVKNEFKASPEKLGG